MCLSTENLAFCNLGHKNLTENTKYNGNPGDSSSSLSLPNDETLNLPIKDFKNRYGKVGLQNIYSINSALITKIPLKDIGLSYSTTLGLFTIKNSASLTHQDISRVIKPLNLKSWYPDMQEDRDSDSNLVFKLTSEHPTNPTQNPNFEFSDPNNLWTTGDSLKSIEVAQSEAIIASISQVPSIQTYALRTCIAVALYDAQLQVGALAHIDNNPRAMGVDSLIQRMNSSDLTATLVMGSQKNYATLKTIVNQLEKHGISSITIYDYDPTTESRDVNLNLKDGRVSLYNEHVPYKNGVERTNFNITSGNALTTEYLSIRSILDSPTPALPDTGKKASIFQFLTDFIKGEAS